MSGIGPPYDFGEVYIRFRSRGPSRGAGRCLCPHLSRVYSTDQIFVN